MACPHLRVVSVPYSVGLVRLTVCDRVWKTTILMKNATNVTLVYNQTESTSLPDNHSLTDIFHSETIKLDS